MEYYSSLDASKLDSETPTIFEIISANQLDALLSPSLRYIIVHFAQKYPGYLLRIANRFDEINLFVRTMIEWYFFKKWRGSFTENFYGIKRVRQTALSKKKYDSNKLAQLAPSLIEERRSLSNIQTAVSIFEVTGLSYFLEKFNYRYELLYSKYITNQLTIDDTSAKAKVLRVKLQILFVKLYPFIQSAWRLCNLFATLSYLSGTTKSPTLLTFLFRVNYARLTQYDFSRNEPPLSDRKPRIPNRVNPPSYLEHLFDFFKSYIAKPSLKSSRFVLGTFFPLAIFSLKFLEWWNSSNFANTIAKAQSNELEDHIPPPSIIKALFDSEKGHKSFYKSKSYCPLCKEEISNPAIIETGHVFCYTCIYNYLRDSHKFVHIGETSDVNYSSDEVEGDSEMSGSENDSQSYIEEETDPVRIEKGGRCPITGVKLLGCKWNEITGEFDVNGIRRLIF